MSAFSNAFGSLGGLLGSTASSMLGGGLASGLGSALGSVLGNIGAGRRMKKQYKYQRKLAEQQQEYNVQNMELENEYAIDAWNRENEYNNPAAVAARNRAAGLDPSGSSNMGSAGVAGSLKVPSSQAVGNVSAPSSGQDSPLSVMSSALDIGRVQNEKRLTDSEVALNEAKAEEIRNRTPDYETGQDIIAETLNSLRLSNGGKRIANDMDSFMLDFERDVRDKKISQLEANLKETRSRIDNLDAGSAQYRSAVSLNNARVVLVGAQTALARSEKYFTDQKARDFVNWMLSPDSIQQLQTFAQGIQEYTYKDMVARYPSLKAMSDVDYYRAVGLLEDPEDLGSNARTYDDFRSMGILLGAVASGASGVGSLASGIGTVLKYMPK